MTVFQCFPYCCQNALMNVIVNMILPLILWIGVLVFVVPLYGLITIPLIIWRLIVNTLVYFFRPDFQSHLTSRDLTFIGDEYYETKARKIVISTIMLNGNLDVKVLRKLFAQRMLTSPQFYRLHCRPFQYFGYWFWQRVPIEVLFTVALFR